MSNQNCCFQSYEVALQFRPWLRWRGVIAAAMPVFGPIMALAFAHVAELDLGEPALPTTAIAVANPIRAMRPSNRVYYPI